jgi:ATP phosphoribosyltransferase regulatory subunit
VISTFRERQIDAACAALTARGGKYFDMPTLLPASLVLELAGEGLRPRLFFVTAPDGSEMCLRPDLTIPAVVQYLQYSEYDNEPSAVACKGQVFRGPRSDEDRPPEFLQIGHERFGDADTVETDVTIFLAAWNACKAADVAPLHVRFCDGGLLDKVVSEAIMPEVWRTALKEQTNHTRAFLNTLAHAGGRAGGRQISALERELVDLPIEAARQKVEAAITAGDLSLATTRSVEDVTDRLITRAKRALAPRLEGPLCDLLHALATFQQTTTPQACLDKVVSLARGLGVNLDAWKTQWLSRFEAIEAQADGILTHCRFDALGEEAFDYYDGMAFDIANSDDFTHPVATGGRYDLLVGKVSAGVRNARAVGCVIRPDRFGLDENGQGG